MSLSQPNDFAADVLAELQRRKTKFRGCQPQFLEYLPGGDLKMWFYGRRNGRPWRGGVTILARADVNTAYVRGNVNAFVEACEQIIDHIQAGELGKEFQHDTSLAF
jgi:hypothetical protein